MSETTVLFLIQWGRVTYICVNEQTIIGSDNDLSPGRYQAIILIEHPGTNFSENLIEIHIFSFTKMHLKMSSGKWRLSDSLKVIILFPVW